MGGGGERGRKREQSKKEIGAGQSEGGGRRKQGFDTVLRRPAWKKKCIFRVIMEIMIQGLIKKTVTPVIAEGVLI